MNYMTLIETLQTFEASTGTVARRVHLSQRQFVDLLYSLYAHGFVSGYCMRHPNNTVTFNGCVVVVGGAVSPFHIDTGPHIVGW